MAEDKRLPQSKRGAVWRRRCVWVIRGLCCAVTLAVLGVFCHQVGQGIARVRSGEMTSAQMLEELGEWMRGKEQGGLS